MHVDIFSSILKIWIIDFGRWIVGLQKNVEIKPSQNITIYTVIALKLDFMCNIAHILLSMYQLCLIVSHFEKNGEKRR